MEKNFRICEYGCGQEAKYQFKNGKWCCSKHYLSCLGIKEKRKQTCLKRYGAENPNQLEEVKKKKKKIYLKNYGVDNPFKVEEIKEKIKQTNLKKYGFEYPNKSKKVKDKRKQTCLKRYGVNSTNQLKKVKEKKRQTCFQKHGVKHYLQSIEAKDKWLQNHSFFCKIEETKIDKNTGEIQVHCKNHECLNSKEKGGWFTPTNSQLYERIRQLEKDYGQGGCYFYCSNKCKEDCPLYNLKSDPLKETSNPYTQEEYKTFRQFVLERDNHQCQYCEGPATIVHHERPQKLEPLFVLDLDFAWSCCKKCHYKYGHKTGTECSTGKLASKIC